MESGPNFYVTCGFNARFLWWELAGSRDRDPEWHKEATATHPSFLLQSIICQSYLYRHSLGLPLQVVHHLLRLTVIITSCRAFTPSILHLVPTSHRPYRFDLRCSDEGESRLPNYCSLSAIILDMSNPLDTDVGSELFSSYEAELKLVQADLGQRLDQISELTGEPRKSAVRQAERSLEEASDLVRLHLSHVFGAPSSGRRH